MHYNQASIIYLFGFPYMVKIYKYAYRLIIIQYCSSVNQKYFYSFVVICLFLG